MTGIEKLGTSVAVLMFVLLPTLTLLEAKPLSKPGEKAFEIRPIKWSVVPKVMGGVAIGEAAKTIKTYDDNFTSRFLYGFGLAAEYNVTPRWALDLEFELGYKDIPNSTYKPIKGTSFGLDAVFKILPGRKTTAFFKAGFGMTSMSIPDYYSTSSGRSPTLDIGTFDFLKLGLGTMNYTGSKTTLRTEIYIRTFYTDGTRVTTIGTAEFNTTYIGLDLAWGIGLF